MAKWSTERRVRFMNKQRAAHRIKEGVEPKQPFVNEAEARPVYTPDQVLDPATLEEKMVQLVRSVRLRTIDEVKHSLLSTIDEMKARK